MKISVVVSVFNGEEFLGDTLRSLADQDYSSDYEIIIVNDGSTDNSQGVIDQFVSENHQSVKVLVNSENLGLSYSRNRGVEYASGEIVAFTDADCVAPKSWISELSEKWKLLDQEVVGLGGVVVGFSFDTMNQKYCDAAEILRPTRESGHKRTTFLRRLMAYYTPEDASLKVASSFIGANMSYRRESLLSVEGFDVGIKFGGDEVELARRLRVKYGSNSLIVSSDIKILHQFHRALRDSFRRSYMYGKSDGERFAKKISGFSTSPTLTLYLLSTFGILFGFMSLGIPLNSSFLLALNFGFLPWIVLLFRVKFRGNKYNFGTKIVFCLIWFCAEFSNFCGFIVGVAPGLRRSRKSTYDC